MVEQDRHPAQKFNRAGTFVAIERSLNALAGLSRTFTGESNTDVSSRKTPLFLAGEELAKVVRANVYDAVTALLEYGPNDVRGQIDAETLLCNTAVRVNNGLLAPDRSIFRAWNTEIAVHSPMEQVELEFSKFAEDFATRWCGGFQAPVDFAAWVEYRSNARGHFFTDGCGRISRAISIASLGRAGLTYPQFKNRGEYFDLIAGSLESWTVQYRSRIPLILRS